MSAANANPLARSVVPLLRRAGLRFRVRGGTAETEGDASVQRPGTRYAERRRHLCRRRGFRPSVENVSAAMSRPSGHRRATPSYALRRAPERTGRAPGVDGRGASGIEGDDRTSPKPSPAGRQVPPPSVVFTSCPRLRATYTVTGFDGIDEDLRHRELGSPFSLEDFQVMPPSVLFASPGATLPPPAYNVVGL